MSTACDSLRGEGGPKLQFSDTKSEGSMETPIVNGAPKVCILGVRYKATLAWIPGSLPVIHGPPNFNLEV